MTKQLYFQHSLESSLTNISYSVQQLEQLKCDFQNQIDSKRAYSKIKNLKDLERILIKRDCNIKILHDKLEEIQKTNQKSYTTEYSERQPVLPTIPSDPVQRIDQLIATEIGQKWKNLARELRIPEGKIDDFSSSYSTLEDIIREVLRYHRSNEVFWKTKLCKALELARRKDLSLKVQKILELSRML